MHTRERFVKTLTGQKVDRVPFMKVFGGDNAHHKHWEDEHPGIGECIDELLGFEGRLRGWTKPPVNMDSSQLGESRVLKEADGIVTHDRGDGTIEQVHGSGDYNRHTVDWPIKDWTTWSKMSSSISSNAGKTWPQRTAP